MKNLLLILGFPLWFPLLISFYAVMFSFYIVLWAVIISLIALFISLIISGIVIGVGEGIFLILSGNSITGLALIGAGIFAVGLSIFMFYCSKGLIIFSKKTINCLVKMFRKG